MYSVIITGDFDQLCAVGDEQQRLGAYLFTIAEVQRRNTVVFSWRRASAITGLWRNQIADAMYGLALQGIIRFAVASAA